MTQRELVTACLVTAIWLVEAKANSAQAQDLYCNFVNVAVPCEKLSAPLYLDGQEPWIVRYRFSKWVPIWPNQAIFGPVIEKPSFDHSDSYKLKVDEFFNRTIDRPDSHDSIEFRKPSAVSFKKDFVDRDFVDDSFYRDRHLTKGLKSTLVPIDQPIYWGQAVFEAWLRTLSAGVICSDSRCAFTRKSADATSIEYCIFTEVDAQKIRDTPLCRTVASERNGHRSILATKYTGHDAKLADAVVAAGESTITCDLPRKSVARGFQQLQTFVGEYLGPTSRIAIEKGHIEAEGMKIAASEEGGFLRAYLYAWTEVAEDGDGLIEMHPSFTFSAQASDDITDYRELNKASGMRISNRFYGKFVEGMKMVAPDARCRP